MSPKHQTRCLVHIPVPGNPLLVAWLWTTLPLSTSVSASVDGDNNSASLLRLSRGLNSQNMANNLERFWVHSKFVRNASHLLIHVVFPLGWIFKGSWDLLTDLHVGFAIDLPPMGQPYLHHLMGPPDIWGSLSWSKAVSSQSWVLGGRETEDGGDLYIVMMDLCGEWQKPSQHCKAVILQL